jgi:hypothetical protein
MRSGIVLSIAALLCAGSASAQASSGFGAVIGLVLDRVGNGMPDTTIVLSNEALGIERTLITTDDGVFAAATVVPFEGYRLKVSKKDYASWASAPFTVSTGQKRSFEIILQADEPADSGVKAVSQGGLRLVDDFFSGLGAVNTPEQIDTVPSSGRRLKTLVPLAPAVVTAFSVPGQMVFHGVPFTNPLLLDGISVTNNYFVNPPATPDPVNLDSVQDFYTASSNFTAEFGNTMGGFLDAASHSGATAFHGQAYEYFRDDGWQAGDRYAAGFDTRQRFAGTICSSS